jgi:hypothetical protein
MKTTEGNNGILATNDKELIEELNAIAATSKDITINKERLLKELEHVWKCKYWQCGEGEIREDYPKRVLMGEGFLDAIRFIEQAYKTTT